MVRGIPANDLKITEGALLAVNPGELANMTAKLTPDARRAFAAYFAKHPATQFQADG